MVPGCRYVVRFLTVLLAARALPKVGLIQELVAERDIGSVVYSMRNVHFPGEINNDRYGGLSLSFPRLHCGEISTIVRGHTTPRGLSLLSQCVVDLI